MRASHDRHGAQATAGDPRVDYEQLLVERNAPRWLRKLKKDSFLEEQPSRYAAPAS